MATMGEVFGAKFAEALTTHLLRECAGKPKISDIEAGCKAVGQEVLDFWSKRAANRSGLAVRLFFGFDELGVPQGEEADDGEDAD